MTELDTLIAAAYASEGKQDDVNKVYIKFLQTPLFIPVEKKTAAEKLDVKPGDEPFRPLFAVVEESYFMLVFDSEARLRNWAADQMDMIDYVQIAGKDIVAGLSDKVFLGLNLGEPHYKEFSPDEVAHLKKIVGRIEQMRGEG